MPLTLRLWLLLTRVLAGPLRLAAAALHRKQGVPDDRLGERLGQAGAPRASGDLIWIHCASLGEASQTKQLVAILEESRGAKVLFTTVTASGANWVAQNMPQALHQFVPLDTPKAVEGFLDHWAPDLAVFVEADLWPRLVLKTAERGIPLALVNARPSRSRDRAPAFFGHLLSHFAVITCKSQQVQQGFAALGIPADKVFHFGDLRASVSALPVDAGWLEQLRTVTAQRPVWIAASSHAGDEGAIVDAHRFVLQHHPDALLIWAPRHPTRSAAILSAAEGLATAQRSQDAPLTAQTRIYLADTFGELGTLFSLCKIVFLGGSFGGEGGHNPYEPAAFGCTILTGPNQRNHGDGFDALARVGAAKTVADGDALGKSVVALIGDGNAEQNGAKGQSLVRQSGDAAEQTAQLLTGLLRG